MASSQNIAAFLAAWDAAFTAYTALRGAFALTNVMNSGEDMRSTATAGLWTLVGAAVPTNVPNSMIEVEFTDGTGSIWVTYDELALMTSAYPAFDAFFGIHYKVWRMSDIMDTAMQTLGFVAATPPGAGYWTAADYMQLIQDLANEGQLDEMSGLP